MTKFNNFCLFVFLFFFSVCIGNHTVLAQCMETYDWVKQEDICGDPNNGSATVFFTNNASPCDAGNGNLDLHVYYYINPGPLKAPAVFDPFQGASYITTTPLPNNNLFYLGSIDAADLCASAYFFNHSFVNSITCSGQDVTFFLIPWDRDLDSDNNGVFGEYNQTSATCTWSREEFTILGAPCNSLVEATVTSIRKTCDGGPGAASVSASGGIPPYTYLWSNGATTSSITGLLQTGFIFVTVTDDVGCTKTAAGYTQNPAPAIVCTLSSTNVSCNSVNDGTATITAVPPATFCVVTGYIWSTGDTTSTITGLSPGTYSVTATTDACCPSVCSITVAEPPALLSAIGNVVDNDCAGDNDGSAVGTVSGGIPPYQFSWDTGITNQVISGLEAGTYTLTITDSLGCVVVDSIVITDPAKLSAIIGITDELCETNSGEAEVNPVGGNAPYRIDWSNGQTAPTATGLAAGQYSVSVLDEKGCCLNLTLIVGQDDCDLCIDAILGDLDICDTLSVDPTLPLSTADCDGDGVTNADECTDGTDPLDPCDFVDTSITGPVTADQADCVNLCPDLTPITTILPGNIAGVSQVEVAVEITELNTIDTDGSTIIIRMPSDPRLVFTWDPALTIAALVMVQNADWNYLGNNGIVHTWVYNGTGLVIAGGATSAFGFQSIYDPQSTDGQTTITASIIPFSGGECNILNNTDSERLVYFE